MDMTNYKYLYPVNFCGGGMFQYVDFFSRNLRPTYLVSILCFTGVCVEECPKVSGTILILLLSLHMAVFMTHSQRDLHGPAVLLACLTII
jgi:hypothetical protein